MIIGFTGTRRGLSNFQRGFLTKYLEHVSWTEFHHGDCIGADEQVAHIAMCHCGDREVIAHPCNLYQMRSTRHKYTSALPIDAPLKRNRDIVDACDILIACPKSASEERRSGTWYTIRYARRVGKCVDIVTDPGIA